MGRPPVHGLSGSPTWNSWMGMITRCTNPRIARARSYAKKGITFCARWKKFGNFLEDMGFRPYGMTLERKNRLGHYEPSNCIWASPKVQAVNRSSTHLISAKGKTMCLTDWARKLNIQPSAIRWRLNHGWGEKAAVTCMPRRDVRRAYRVTPL